MGKKLYCSLGVLALSLFVPEISMAGTIKTIQVYNNLYNQAASATGVTPSNSTINLYYGGTKCDTVTLNFRNIITELVGTGSNQKCADVTSVQIVAGFSVANPSVQVYSTTPVTVTLTSADYVHAIIIQDLGTGVTGTAASDGSIAPIFNVADGAVATLGTLGTILLESKLI